MKALVCVWERWKRIGKKIGEFQSRVILGVFYFVIVCPFAIIVQLTSDPLLIRPKTTKGWQQRNRCGPASIENARRQS
jgi:hypothetical protein